VVATVTRSFGPASIIANSRTFARDARYSVCPGNGNPARAIHCLEIGAVTSAAASPASAAAVAAARYASCARPPSSFGLPGGTSPGTRLVTARTLSAAGGETPAAPAARASTPASPYTTASTSGRAASARTTTSGPIPHGSPSEIAMRAINSS
jgi:hypothetical protein